MNKERKIIDYSSIVAERVPALTGPAEADRSRVADALSGLLALEKRTRLAADLDSSLVVAKAILELLHRHGMWTELAEHIALLCKRRAQMQKVSHMLITTGVSWIEETPDAETRRAYLVQLREVSAGKIFVELERARVTRLLSQMNEEAGDLAEAASIMLEVQVETIGSMEIKEKAEFLLEQLRLTLDTQDWVRAEIITKKINPSVMDDKESADMRALKIKYNRLMIRLHNHSKRYFDVAKAYYAIFSTQVLPPPAAPETADDAPAPMEVDEDEEAEVEDEDAWKDSLSCAVVFLGLSEFDSEVSDLTHRVLKTCAKRLRALPTMQALLELFTTPELIPWPLPMHDQFKDSHPVFIDAEEGDDRFETLRKRVVQHNIRTVAGYYDRIRSTQLAQLLSLSEDELERFVAELVSSKQLFAKIDRPSGIIVFTAPKTPATTLNEYASDVSQLLALVNKTCHLISKENMMHHIDG